MLLLKKINTTRGLANIKNAAILLVLLVACNGIGINAAPVSDISEVGNISPTIDLNITPAQKPVDIVVMTDYTGMKLAALNTQINALKAQFSAVNVDPVFHIVSGMKKVGTQNDKLYSIYRYAHYNYQVNYYETYSPSSSWNYYHQYWQEVDVLWESSQILASQFGSMPKRSPQNIGITKSALQSRYRSDGSLWETYYNVTINCTNDIKSSSDTMMVSREYNSDTTEHYFDYIMNENASIDSAWTVSSAGTAVSYDVYSFDFDSLSTIPLRPGSDRHMVFISDGYAKDYGKALGDYFSFGDMTETLANYIKINNYTLYSVSPEESRKQTLLPDKVTKIFPIGDAALFYMDNGKVLKSGTFMGGTVYNEFIGAVGEVKGRLESPAYYLMQDGTIKYYNSASGSMDTIAGITNAVKMFYDGSSGRVFVIDSGGTVRGVKPGSLSVSLVACGAAITDIFEISQGCVLYVTAAGEPYMLQRVFNQSTGAETFSLVRAQIRNDANVYRNLPNIKDADWFTASSADGNDKSATLLLYTTGQAQQIGATRPQTVASNIWTYSQCLYESATSYPSISEDNVSSVDGNGSCVFIYKNDGTVKWLGGDYYTGTYWDDNDRKRTGTLSKLRDSAISFPYSNIRSVGKHKGMYFFTDGSNTEYEYYVTNTAISPVDASFFSIVGSNLKKLVKNTYDYTNQNVYLLFADGTAKYINLYGSTVSSPILLPYNNITDIWTGLGGDYLLTNDGKALYKSLSGSSFSDCFTNPLTIDTTKTYLSLLDVLNKGINGAFYPAGGYPAAFNDIYKNYGSYSTGGNMYIVLGDAIKYDSVYDDYENDPEYARKWSISHEPYYFDNSMGLSAYHNPTGFAVDPPDVFDKVGKYTINLYARDNPKPNNLFDNYRLWSLGDPNLAVYIHRRPMALLKTNITSNGNGTYTVAVSDAGSYDLDHNNSRTDKGIAAREWRWRESASTLWTNTQMNKNDCDTDENYIIQMRVKDVEGVWSDYDTVTIDRNNPPAALFTLDKTIIRDTEVLKVKDQSFPQSFSAIARWHWVVKKLNADGSVPAANLQNAQFTDSNAGTGVLSGYDANVKSSYTGSGAGIYRIYLRVKDSNGLWSDGGTDSMMPEDLILSKYYSMDFVVDKPPSPGFTVANSVIKTTDLLRITDTTTITGLSTVAKWHWIVKKLNADGSVPAADLQNEIFATHNGGSGELAGCDANVKTNYSAEGTGIYRIYLRAMNGNGMWSGFFYRDIVVDSLPIASFIIEKNPIEPNELLKLKDTSVKTGVSPIAKWHWIVKKLDADGSEPVSSLQDEQFADSNKGLGGLTDYDGNVMTDYSEEGSGTYRIYLRACNSSGMWSDGGTDSSADLSKCFHRDLMVQEAYKLSNFRVVKVKDLHLSSFYYNPATGQYDDRPMGVNTMAVDSRNFNNMVDGLTKGYIFEFEIDTVNFNGNNDTIRIIPRFYTCDNSGRDSDERDLYWEDSRHRILKAGEGGHAEWAEVNLEGEDRIIMGENNATWRGSYLIPGTAWAVPRSTTADNASACRLDRDIIVNFEIQGYKDGIMKFDYNLNQWPVERSVGKYPYETGDVIRYSYKKNNLEDIGVILNRP